MTILPFNPENATEFFAKAGKTWSADPVFNNLQWALSLRYCQDDGPYAAAIFEEEGKQWIGLHTVEKRPLLLNGPDEIPDTVARAIVRYFSDAAGLTASKATIDQLAGAWGKPISDFVAMYLYELSELAPKLEFQGKIRQVVSSDRDLLVRWIEAFAISINERLIGRNYGQEADNMIEKGQIWFLEIDGEIVSMAGSTRSVGGVACVNYVYTPEKLRGMGFASSNVGLLSEYLLLSHDKVCLYAEEDYPASNRVYQKLGYEIVARTVEVEFGE